MPSNKVNQRELGGIYEQRTAVWLRDCGYRILEMNYRCRVGEIDLIAERSGVLCFVEVKYRRTSSHGFSEDAVDFRKQRRIRRTAEWYLNERQLPDDLCCRFDVAAFDGETLQYYENAFGGM